MNKTGKSFMDKRLIGSSTPLSRSSKKIIKQEVSIEDIYNEVRQKINEMQSAFKSEHLDRQRQMLKTYVKILDKIGVEVMSAKEKYMNLDKQNLKTKKRLEIVTQLNKERENCNILTKNIKTAKQQIKKYEDQNNYLEQEVEALQNIANRKKSISKSQHLKYRTSKEKARSLQKRWTDEFNENDKSTPVPKRSLEISSRFDIKNRAKSFMINSQEPDASTQMEGSSSKPYERPHTQQKYIGNRRNKNKYFNVPLQQNGQVSQFT